VRRRLGSSRLVTLTGPGGVGKTRLAVRAAGDSAARYRDGVWFVDLAAVADALMVTEAVVAGFGIQDESSRWSVSALTDYLTDRRLLLILDNCEHVLDATALLAGALLRACPDLRILATSRQALGIAGEVIQPVDPLGLPDESVASAEAGLRSDAVALFLERVTGVAGGLPLADRDLEGVLATCRRLDGIPLALELAAVRLRTLGPDVLAEGFGARALALVTGDRSAAPRQQSLNATIDWSYRLLTDPQQLLWTRLAVFAGGFELDAATSVCSDAAIPADDVPGLLAALVDRSLVVRDEEAGRQRFRILQVLRQFALDQLERSGTADAFRLRHAAWVSEIGAQLWANDGRQGALFARIRAERANVWAALDFCVQQPAEAARGIAICRDLWSYWQTERPVSDVLRILDSLLERVDAGSRSAGTGFWVSAFLTAIQRDLVATRDRADRALAIGRAQRDPELVAWALLALGAAAVHEGRWDDAERLAGEASALGRTMDLPMPSLIGRYVLTDAQFEGGHFEAALASGDGAIAMSEGLGESWVRSYLYNVLALANLGLGRTRAAAILARRGLTLRNDLGDVHGMALIVGALASIAIAERAPERAATLLGGAESIWRAVMGTLGRPARAEVERVQIAAQAALGAARFEAAFAAGLNLPRSALLDFALGDAARPGRTRERRPQAAAGPLSRRELEIARLVADGATNGETAGRLFISERTVESHMASIFNKLGVDSRVQVARWIASLEAIAPEA
jgi:non-specific serine/threonine protein kinase